MQNPFESGHIKNYILLYVSVVVIMVLFFIATTLFHDVEEVDKKVFAEAKENLHVEKKEPLQERTPSHQFKLLEKAY
ncbi:MAG: hypothetical protein RBT52_02605 [Sulfurimonas sp.]|jgi:hypothetical protein|nr:hypothetical protein [Sulfurimonas sp.]